jgi:hypothetical protein
VFIEEEEEEVVILEGRGGEEDREREEEREEFEEEGVKEARVAEEAVAVERVGAAEAEELCLLGRMPCDVWRREWIGWVMVDVELTDGARWGGLNVE